MGEIKNENNLEFLISLKTSKKDGILDLEDNLQCQKHKWRNTVDYKLLEYLLTCESEEVYHYRFCHIAI